MLFRSLSCLSFFHSFLLFSARQPITCSHWGFKGHSVVMVGFSPIMPPDRLVIADVRFSIFAGCLFDSSFLNDHVMSFMSLVSCTQTIEEACEINELLCMFCYGCF